jgi:LysR family transcriptional regulator, cell division regulator
MHPNEIRYFLEIADAGNFSRAAERLGVSQPALSQSVRKLEKSFGNALFVRTRAGVQLTRTGQALFTRGKRLVLEWEDLIDEASRDRDELRGNYRLGCHPSVGLYTLPRVLPELLTRHPKLRFALVHDLSRRITEKVIGFELDFGIVINPVRHPDLVIRKLGTDTVGLWKKKDASKNTELPEGVLICDPELIQTQNLLKEFQKAGIKFSRQIDCSNLEVIASLVAAGCGVGLLPARVATRIHEYALEVANAKYPVFQDQVCLIYRSDSLSSQAAKLLARSLAAELENV